MESYKQNEDFRLERNNILLDDSKQEKPFIADDSELRSICQYFVENPYQNLEILFKISDILVESSPSLIKFLYNINFFQAFGNFLNKIQQPEERIISLQILLKLTRLSTSECLALINGENLALTFLKNQIFSDIVEIKYLSLKCLKHFAQDSQSCRLFIILYNFIFDLRMLLIGCKDDAKMILIIEKIFSFLLLEQLSDENIKDLRKTAFDLIKYNYGTDISCRILCYLSEKEEAVDKEFIENADNLVKFLKTAQNAKCLRYLMKFFFVRSDFTEEATAFFLNELFPTLVDTFFNSKNDDDKFNKQDDKIDWSCKLIGKVIEKVNDSIAQFFEIGFFDNLIFLANEGNYRVKSSSAYVLSRVLLKVKANKIQLTESQINDLYDTSSVYVMLIDTIDENTILSVFDFFLSFISILNDPKKVISLLCETENFENLSTISEQSSNEALRDRATEIIRIINTL